MNFKNFHSLQEAFDKPYTFEMERRDGGGLIAYTFTVHDADDPYPIEVAFSADTILSNYINRSSIDYYDVYVSEFYPEALKPSNVTVTELAFTDLETGLLTKNMRSGHKATRTIGTILYIVAHYLITRGPQVLMFTGAKEENRGKIYDTLIRYVMSSGKFPNYFYFKEDYKNDTRFWVFDSEQVPYMDDEQFQEFIQIQLTAPSAGSQQAHDAHQARYGN